MDLPIESAQALADGNLEESEIEGCHFGNSHIDSVLFRLVQTKRALRELIVGSSRASYYMPCSLWLPGDPLV